MGLKFPVPQRCHMHVFSCAPLGSRHMTQPGRGKVQAELAIGEGPHDFHASADFLHQPLQWVVRPDLAPVAVGKAVIAERLVDLLLDPIGCLVHSHGAQLGDHGARSTPPRARGVRASPIHEGTVNVDLWLGARYRRIPPRLKPSINLLVEFQNRRRRHLRAPFRLGYVLDPPDRNARQV